MLFSTFELEQQFWDAGSNLVCGVDEVGRGCFAGPVVAGAVVFSSNSKLPQGLADSKLLNPKKRAELDKVIKECATSWAIGLVEVEVINQVGIGKAVQLAFVKAVHQITPSPDQILIDAFYIDNLDRDYQHPIKNGDKICSTIAAASIIAKVYRDDLMEQLHLKCPEYGFDKHKGYGTKLHQQAIKLHGLSKHHRTSFNLAKFT